ncbi:flagellar basal body-associated FliL family protein [bacterium]|nr:flagellar basal body-associated FliL family protein [bacterium]MBU1651083.1 flagellar basal body-associated FliL family protein [bacterium]MBU1881022.1 flagellar basal body-associated FliL family protein [bacterium]
MQNPIVKILIIVFAAVGLLVVEVATSRMLIKNMFFKPEKETVQHPEMHYAGHIYMIDDLVINPANSGGRRHLLVSLGLEYLIASEGGGGEGGGHSGGAEGKELVGVGAELSLREPQIRDNLITLLAGQDISILSDIQYREKIRESLHKSINYHLETGQVEKLYFVKYVFQ